MAIDTQEKRMAAASVMRPWKRTPQPTGTIDEQERAGIGNSYGGNALTPAAGGEQGFYFGRQVY